LVALAVLVWRGLEELRLKDVSESFGLAGHEQKTTRSVPRRFELFGSLPARLLGAPWVWGCRRLMRP